MLNDGGEKVEGLMSSEQGWLKSGHGWVVKWSCERSEVSMSVVGLGTQSFRQQLSTVTTASSRSACVFCERLSYRNSSGC